MNLLRLVLICIGFSSVALAGSEPPFKLAVIDQDHSPLGAQIEVALSQTKGVALVERNDFPLLVEEMRLSALIAERKFSTLGRLLSADGLLVLERIRLPDGTEHPTIRLIAVRNGACLLFLTVPNGEMLENWADGLPARLLPVFPMARTTPDEALPMTLVALRGSIFSADSTTRESALARLLEIRLSSVPGVVLLERRRMEDLQFERSLEAADLPSLLEGSLLIDGVIEDVGAQQPLKVTLRLRRRSGLLIDEFSVTGSSDNLPTLVDFLAVGVLAKLHKPTYFHFSALEQEEFLDEAIWAFRSGLIERTEEALGAARALGGTSADALALEALTLLERAMPTGYYWGIHFPKRLPPPPEEQSQLLERAFVRIAEFRASGGTLQRIEGDLQKNLQHYRILDEAIRRASEFLDRNNSAAHPVDATKLRVTVKAAAEMASGGISVSFLQEESAKHAKDWASSAEELILFYEMLLRSNQKQLHRLVKSFPITAEQALGPRFFKSQGAVEAWDAFWKRMLDDPFTRPRAQLILSGRAETHERESMYRKYLFELASQVKVLAGQNQIDGLLQSDAIGRWAAGRFQHERTAAFIALCRDLPYFVFGLFYALDDLKFAPGHEQAAWSAFNAYRERCLSTICEAAKTERMESEFGQWTGIIRLNNPTLSSASPEGALTVSRFWHPYDMEPWKNVGLGIGSIVAEGSSVWIVGRGSFVDDEILEIALPSLQVQRHIFSCVNGEAIDATPQEVWLLHNDDKGDGRPANKFLSRLDRRTKELRSFPLPAGEEVSVIDGRVFVQFSSSREMNADGLLELDVNTGQSAVIISGRRIPPQSSFDDNADLRVRGVAYGPGRKLVVVIEGEREGVYEIGDNSIRYDSILWPELLRFGDLTLLAGVEGKVILIDPEQSKPIVWIDSPKSGESSITAARWRAPRPGMDFRLGTGFRKDELFFLERNSRGQHVLRWWFDQGPQDGVLVPLIFAFDVSQLKKLESIKSFSQGGNAIGTFIDPERGRSPLMLVVTEEGIVLHNREHGFWFIPNSDLENWRKVWTSKNGP